VADLTVWALRREARRAADLQTTHLKASLEAEAQSAKVIEGEAVPSLPPPASAKNS